MPDWTKSMDRTYEYYIVDPGTWKDVKRVNGVLTSTLNRDKTVETLGSATFDIEESIGEAYVRVYLITIQNGVRERHALGTYLVQTPSSSFDGKMKTISLDAYTPLLELKENQPPLGYYVPKEENIMDTAYRLIREKARAPVVQTKCDIKVFTDFVADTEDTWLSYTSDLVSNAKYELDLDELGRILFAPKQDLNAMQPVWTYTDDNSSILYPELTVDNDMYDVPNVVEVLYTNNGQFFYSRVVNDDETSPISIQNRGREITHRVINPDLMGYINGDKIDEYAKQLLRELSSLVYTVTYTHGYCPVRVGDCVRLNYTRAGMTNIKARVISQSIECTPSCPVTETATFINKLWKG